MAYQGINTGTGANTDTGDTLLSGAEKINSNFIELYAAVGIGSTSSHVVTDVFAGDNIGVNTTTGEVTISVVGLTTSFVGGEDISVTTNAGVTTISYVGAANTSKINAQSLVVSGISTLGIVTGATYFGDGSNLTGIAHSTDITETFLEFDGPQQTQEEIYNQYHSQ